MRPALPQRLHVVQRLLRLLQAAPCVCIQQQLFHLIITLHMRMVAHLQQQSSSKNSGERSKASTVA
jgi:hypothetical protein